MTVTPILDPQDPRLDPFRRLSDGELLRTRGLFVAEGRLVVGRVLADASYPVRAVLVNRASLDVLRPLLEARPEDLAVYECATQAFEVITGFNLHRGCLALVERPAVLSWRDAVAAARLVVVLEGVTDADNVGSVFRNAAAFGAGAVLLSPTCCDPLYRKAVRTSMGHVLRVPFARLEPWPDALADVKAAGFRVFALSPRVPSTALETFAARHGNARLAMVVGTEGSGLTAAAEQHADIRVRIPINDAVDSLNVAVATAVALYRLNLAAVGVSDSSSGTTQAPA